MFKINKMTLYSVSILSCLQDGKTLSVPDITLKTLIPIPTVAKICKTLQKNGFIKSIRGPVGGYTLAKPLKNVNVAEIIETFEGPIKITNCILNNPSCNLSDSCARRLNWLKVNHLLTNALKQLSLADMASSKRCSDA